MAQTPSTTESKSCSCGQIACCCWVFDKHPDPKCTFRKSMLCPVGIECDHGRDVCPICDPCTCNPETVGQYRALIRGQRAANHHFQENVVSNQTCGAIGASIKTGDAVTCHRPFGHDGDHQSGLDEWPQTSLFDAILNAARKVGIAQKLSAHHITEMVKAVQEFNRTTARSVEALVFLKRAGDDGRIVSSNDLTHHQIVEAQAAKRFYVDEPTGFGWALLPWDLTTDKDKTRETGVEWKDAHPTSPRPFDIVAAINSLRANDGASVEILCDNPEPETKAETVAVVVTDDWTNWQPRRFYGPDLAAALESAMHEKSNSLGK